MLNVNKTLCNLYSENENNEFCCIDGTTGSLNRRLKTMTLNACLMGTLMFQYTCTWTLNLRVHVSLNYTHFNTDSIKTCTFLFLNTREIETLSVDTKFKTSVVEAIEVGTLVYVVSRAFRRDRTLFCY